MEIPSSDDIHRLTVAEFDTTKLLAHATQAGAKTIGGVEMFVRQAAGQFQAWTGKPAPTALMRQVIERRLTGK